MIVWHLLHLEGLAPKLSEVTMISLASASVTIAPIVAAVYKAVNVLILTHPSRTPFINFDSADSFTGNPILYRCQFVLLRIAICMVIFG